MEILAVVEALLFVCVGNTLRLLARRMLSTEKRELIHSP